MALSARTIQDRPEHTGGQTAARTGWARGAIAGVLALSLAVLAPSAPSLAQDSRGNDSATLDTLQEKEGDKQLRFTLAMQPPADSDEAKAAESLQALLQTAFDIRNNDSLTEEQRFVAFQALFSEGLAIDFLGRLMLGRHRRTADDAQLAAYQDVFPGYITNIYASQLAKLTKVDMSVIDIVALNNQDVLIRTRLERPNGDPITVDWRIRQTGEDQRQIVDILVEGASIMLTKRDEFNALVKARGFDALVAELQERATAEDA